MGEQLSPRHAEGQRAPFTSPLVPAAFPGHPLAGHTVIGSMAPPRRRQRVETKTEPPPPRPSPHRQRAAPAGLRSRGPQARPRPCLQSPGNSAPGPAPAALPYLASGEARGQQLRQTPAARYLCPQVVVCALR